MPLGGFGPPGKSPPPISSKVGVDDREVLMSASYWPAAVLIILSVLGVLHHLVEHPGSSCCLSFTQEMGEAQRREVTCPGSHG